MFTLKNPSSSFVTGDLSFTTFELPSVSDLAVMRTGNETFFVETGVSIHEVIVKVEDGRVATEEVSVRSKEYDAVDYFFGKPLKLTSGIRNVEENDTCISCPFLTDNERIYRNSEGKIVTGCDMHIASVPYSTTSTNYVKHAEGWDAQRHYGRSYTENVLTNLITQEITVVYTDMGYEPYFFLLGGEMYYTREMVYDQLVFIRYRDGKILYNTSTACSSFSGKDFIVFCKESEYEGDIATVTIAVPVHTPPPIELLGPVLRGEVTNGKSRVTDLVSLLSKEFLS